jgi:hypothetical protein
LLQQRRYEKKLVEMVEEIDLNQEEDQESDYSIEF